MTLHQLRTHPEYVAGCYACKLGTVTSYGATPSRTGIDATREKKWQDECESYRAAVKQGVEPDGTTKAKVEFAKAMSDHTGVAYGTPAFKEKLIKDTLERHTK